MEDWAEHLRGVVRGCFPPDARVIRMPQSDDLAFAISWRLNTDPSRPAKRSKVVLLKIDEEAFDHYRKTSDAFRKDIDARLEQTLRKQFSEFDPDHQTPVREEVPIVNWVVNTVVMEG